MGRRVGECKRNGGRVWEEGWESGGKGGRVWEEEWESVGGGVG